MYTKTQRFCDRAVVPLPPIITAVAAGAVAVDVAKDTSLDPNIGEIAGRFIQNVGSGIAYVAIGVDATGTEYHFALPALGAPINLVDITDFGRGRVSVYSTAGTSISVITLRRTEAQQAGQGEILPGYKHGPNNP